MQLQSLRVQVICKVCNFFYRASSIEMGDDIAKMLHIHLGFFQLLGYAWDPALIIALTSKYLIKLLAFSRKKLALL